MSNLLDPRFNTNDRLDVVLVGAGIMSATLAYMLHTLQPDWRIEVYERLDNVAKESSAAWNNAGTGHAGNCELNYTPRKEDGSISVGKAMQICEQFEETKQFYAHLVERGVISDPSTFIQEVPHMSVTFTEENNMFLKDRWEKLRTYPLFQDMQYSEDIDQIKKWAPNLLLGRDPDQPICATYVQHGCDVNFGALTEQIFGYLKTNANFKLYKNSEVSDIDLVEEEDHLWQMKIRNLNDGEKKYIDAKFVFIGAGGGALNLLQKTNIIEGQGFGGFPVSGQWLICKNQELIKQHHVKIYGKADVGAPPMSVPHLDTRIIDSKKTLLFGPYAGFSTKFLKNGSYWDLFETLEIDNMKPLVKAGIDNIPLTRYLINQVVQTHVDRMNVLRTFIPNAKDEDWELQEAGQRVQIIKKDKERGGILEFGTEVISAHDGSVAALLGASPGASTAISIMLELIEKCFVDNIKNGWDKKILEMVPSHGQALGRNIDTLQATRTRTHHVLGLSSITM